MKGKMTVYEMIQELAQYPADQLIEVNVYADGFGVEAEAQEEAEEGQYREAHRTSEAAQHREPARIHRTAL